MEEESGHNEANQQVSVDNTDPLEEGSSPNSEASQQVFVESQNASYSYDHQYLNLEDGGLNYKRKIGAADSKNGGETSRLLDARSLEDYIHGPPPLGLKLRKTPSAVKIIEEELNRTLSERKKESQSQPIAKKFTAVYFPASLLRIGAFNIVAAHEQGLVAGCYYAKRKLVWEILDEGTLIKNKIVVLWQNILAMRVVIEKNRPGILEVELDKEPMFYHETDPRPRSHTTWELSEDFTGGQALTYRRHYLEFPPGVLDKHYEKLIQCDKRLLELSQRPFPSLKSPYFSSDILYQGGGTDYSHSHGYDLREWNTNPVNHQQPAAPVILTQQAEQSSSLVYSTSPTSVVDIPSTHVNVFNNRILEDPKLALSIEELDHYANMWATDSMSCASEAELQTCGTDYENFSDIDIWQTDCDSDQRNMTNFNSSSTYAGLSMEVNPAYNNNYTSTQIVDLPNTRVNSMEALSYGYGWEEHYNSASTANMNDMYGVLSDEGRLVLNTQALHYIPPLQVANENLETHLPAADTLHPHYVTPERKQDNHDHHGRSCKVFSNSSSPLRSSIGG